MHRESCHDPDESICFKSARLGEAFPVGAHETEETCQLFGDYLFDDGDGESRFECMDLMT